MLNAGARNISGFRVRVEQLHGTSILKTFVDIFEIQISKLYLLVLEEFFRPVTKSRDK